MSKIFTKFVKSFASGDDSLDYLEEYFIQNPGAKIKNEQGDLFAVSEGVHGLFQVACVDMLEISNKEGTPPLLKRRNSRYKKDNLEDQLSKYISNTIDVPQELSSHLLAEGMIHSVFVPLVNMALKINKSMGAVEKSKKSQNTKAKRFRL